MSIKHDKRRRGEVVEPLRPYVKGEIYRTQIIGGETPLSFEVFKKTPEEKVALANAKSEWRAFMRIKHPGWTKRMGFRIPS